MSHAGLAALALAPGWAFSLFPFFRVAVPSKTQRLELIEVCILHNAKHAQCLIDRVAGDNGTKNQSSFFPNCGSLRTVPAEKLRLNVGDLLCSSGNCLHSLGHSINAFVCEWKE